MKIFVKAKPGAQEAKVEKLDDQRYVVSIKEPPVQGRANAAIIEKLADFFGVSKSQVRIVAGWTSREKIVEIL